MKTKKQHPLDISLCHEVQVHYKRPLYDNEQRLTSSMATENLLRDFVDINRLDYKEFFWVILLSNANQVLGVSEISIGNTTGTYVNYKEIAQLALLTNATGVIIAHNHPSGILKASNSDHATTKSLKKTLDTLHIKLLDHIILTSESYISFADEGWL